MKKNKAAKRPRPKLFTIDQANAMLPLLRSILTDITTLAHDLHGRHEKIVRMQSSGHLDAAHREEIEAMIDDFEKDREKLEEFAKELGALGVELKDHFTGLVDFRAMMDGREVYLCWRMDEPEVGHWHELDSGFSGRKKLTANLV